AAREPRAARGGGRGAQARGPRNRADAGRDHRQAAIYMAPRGVRGRSSSRAPAVLERREASMMEASMTNEQQINDTAQRVRTQRSEIESLIEGLDDQLQRLVAERPMLVLGGTLLAGFVAGRLIARR